MEKIFLSVIMPVFNTKEKYLKEAIKSVLNQTYSNFEFIIIDDGSDEKTKKVLRGFKDKDTRIKLIENEKNSGLIETLNKGLNQAKGRYIVRMDSDDISLPERFQEQLEFMEENKKVGVLGTAYSIFQKREEDVYPPTSDVDIKKTIIRGTSPMAHPSVMIRAEVLGDTKYSDKYKHAEDLALWIKLMDKTEFANLDKILLKYRWYGGNVSKKHTVEQSLNTQILIYICMEKYKNQNCSDEFKIMKKLKEGKRIFTKEYKKLMEKNDITKPNKVFEKYARCRCLNPLVVFGIIK